MKQYDPKTIEPKWQKIWADTQLYRTDDASQLPKWYQLEFFPYPSGVTMHVGHVRNYVISDAIARYQRMNGHNVLHPMGWDAFGLPAENQAIKTGMPPRQSTEANIKVFKRQLQQMGLSYDWSREINSSEPDYYRWTQWLFLLFYKRGLAYKAEALVNWCPHDKTVLANEQVIKKDGQNVCERCGHVVEKRELSQWFFKITEYADRLLSDLDQLDWPENVKAMQRNWIGRSQGASVDFAVAGTKETIEIFTTRPDTLFGATYVVLAPEHPLVDKITSKEQAAEVKQYQQQAGNATELSRLENKEKTGVFTGAYAINPINSEKLPIWVADYVLMSYGTGAIMAVPAHDERDHEFARKFELPIKNVIDPVLVRADAQGMTEFKRKRKIVAIVQNAKGQILTINWGPKLGGRLAIGGTIEGNESPETTALREVEEETGYHKLRVVGVGQETMHYKYYAFSKQEAHDAEVNFVHLELTDEAQKPQNLDDSEQGNFTVEWVSPEVAEREIVEPLHRYGYDKFVHGHIYTGTGLLVNSSKFNGLEGSQAQQAIIEHLFKAKQGKGHTQYRLRDWLISRQRYWGAPIPIVHCAKCGVVPVPEDQLPVELPELKTYQPSDDGRSPLARATDWLHTTCPKCGGPAERETDTMDTFVDSSWYFLRFADPHNTEQPFAKDKADHWLPVDSYVGGVEHAVAHLLFARFWTKVLYDAKLVNFVEPFKMLRNQGMIGGADGRKMGKRYGNATTPDEIIDKGYGADSLRLYEAFIGPYDQGVDWNPTGIDGTSRFLHRVWVLVQEFTSAQATAEPNPVLETALITATHRTIKKVSDDLQKLSLNTVVAALMEYTNELYRLKVELPFGTAREVWAEALGVLARLLAPLAPHIAEELWQELGGTESVHVQSWPKYDPALIKNETMTITIQVNGRVRASLEFSTDASEEQIMAAAKANETVAKHLEGHKVAKTVFVPHKLVNFVVTSAAN